MAVWFLVISSGAYYLFPQGAIPSFAFVSLIDRQSHFSVEAAGICNPFLRFGQASLYSLISLLEGVEVISKLFWISAEEPSLFSGSAAHPAIFRTIIPPSLLLKQVDFLPPHFLFCHRHHPC